MFVVELCDDIRIDTVQLANFEFFSGVFREFTVSVAKTYAAADAEGWTVVGTYVGNLTTCLIVIAHKNTYIHIMFVITTLCSRR